MTRKVRQLSPAKGRKLTVMNISCEPKLKIGMVRIAERRKQSLSAIVLYACRMVFTELQDPDMTPPEVPAVRPGRKSPDDILTFF